MNAHKKRQRKIPGNQQPKRHRSGSNANVPVKMNITNLGVDCLECIFMNFDLDDLLNVADVNKQFRQAATYPFIRKYSKKNIAIEEFEKNVLYYKSDEFKILYKVEGNKLQIRDTKMGMKILRCFGSNISDLRFMYVKKVDVSSRFEHIYYLFIRYINQFCADSLRIIEISPSIGYDNLDLKPFSYVQSVTLEDCLLETSCLSRLFPMMRDLRFSLRNGELRNCAVITEHLTNLKHLDVAMYCQADSVRAAVATGLQMNPQIRTLKISTGDVSFLKNIKMPMQSLDYFKYFGPVELFSKFRGKSAYFPNVQTFKLSLYSRNNYCSRPMNFPRIPFLFGQLNEFIIVENCVCRNAYHKFIKQNKSIQKLVFECTHLKMKKFGHILVDGFLSKSKLKGSLPSLKEISIRSFDGSLSIGEVVRYMEDFQSLNCFSFYCNSSEIEIREQCCNDLKVAHVKESFFSKLYFVRLERKTQT